MNILSPTRKRQGSRSYVYITAKGEQKYVGKHMELDPATWETMVDWVAEVWEGRWSRPSISQALQQAGFRVVERRCEAEYCPYREALEEILELLPHDQTGAIEEARIVAEEILESEGVLT